MPLRPFQVLSFAILSTWLILLLVSPPGHIEAGPNSNISACHFCDDNVDFSVRNLVCCSLTSRCCGPDRI